METYHVKVTDQAKNHLKRIRDYIAIDLKSPMAAKKLLDAFQSSMAQLKTMPDRYRTIDEEPWGNQGVRKIVVKNYYIYFAINDSQKQVQVIAVVYGKRNQEQVLDNL